MHRGSPIVCSIERARVENEQQQHNGQQLVHPTVDRPQQMEAQSGRGFSWTAQMGLRLRGAGESAAPDQGGKVLAWTGCRELFYDF